MALSDKAKANKKKRDRNRLRDLNKIAPENIRIAEERIELDPNDAQAKLLRAAETKLAVTERALTSALKRADDAENVRELCFGLSVADLASPIWPARKFGKGKSIHKPILFTSDFQYGEVVDRAEMDGMNFFDKYVFAERYTLMIDKTIQWARAIGDGWSATYPEGIIYLRGGDAISGEIHEELSMTNDAGAVPAVAELVALEAEGIRRLQEEFGHVHVISIPGNHGRTTRKPPSKGYVKSNFETIISWWLASLFRGDKNYSFEVPESGHAYFEAEGWRFVMTHGDRMGAGGGTGFIGSPAPITKGHLKTRLTHTITGAPVDYVLTGHLHTSMKLPRGFANGSIVGYSEFARGLNLEPDSAKQWLLFAHKARVYGLELELSDFPRRQP